MDRSAGIVGLRAAADDAYTAETDAEKKDARYLGALGAIKEEIEKAPFIQGAEQADIDAALAKFTVDAKKMIIPVQLAQVR